VRPEFEPESFPLSFLGKHRSTLAMATPTSMIASPTTPRISVSQTARRQLLQFICVTEHRQSGKISCKQCNQLRSCSVDRTEMINPYSLREEENADTGHNGRHASRDHQVQGTAGPFWRKVTTSRLLARTFNQLLYVGVSSDIVAFDP
jgi:hypothetical protein